MSEYNFQFNVNEADIDSWNVGLNREAFLKDIFEADFKSNIRLCALALKITPNYLRELLTVKTRGVGCKVLSYIMQYCIHSGRDPIKYIFVRS